MKTTIEYLGHSYPLEGNEDLISRATSITTVETLNPSEIFAGGDFYKGKGAICVLNKKNQMIIYQKDFTCEKKFNYMLDYFSSLGIKVLIEKN